ncbi:MAG: adenylate/guanylate cyclase domain-containing protein [Spirochaetota bacterium]|nr:adenylate/guanylate cyclase domain-containing protein [Spirochaetota bacterium]
MNNVFKFTKNQLIALLITLIIFLMFVFIYSKTNLFDGLEKGAIDFRYFLRDPSEKSKKIREGVRRYKKNPRARDDIIILGIDLNTIRSFAEEGNYWPFPWNIHAKFTRYVGSGNPLAIFFDIMFVDHKPHKEEFARSIRSAKNVFLDYAFESEEVDKKISDIEERKKLLDRLRFPLDPNDNLPPWVEDVEPPIPILSSAARGIGCANIRPDPTDPTIRKLPMIIKFNGFYYPSVDMVIVMHYYGIGKNDIEIKIGKHIKLKNLPIEKMAKPNEAREISIPIDREGFMNINYIGGYGSFQHYPYYYFYQDGEMTNKSLENKIILVAAYAATGIASDIHKSPYGETYGIEHHANMLNTILNQDFIVELSDFENILILLIIALLLGIILVRISIVKSIVLTVIFIIGYIIGVYILFDTISLICIFATPLIQIGVTFSVIIAYRVLTEQREKKYIRQTFSKFVSKSVVDDLLKNPEKLKLGGEKKILTVLFSDIRGFTSISEKMTPEGLVEHLNEYLESMTDITFKYYGTLDKYVGDEIMAFWGAPISQEDHALLACKAALEMMIKLDDLNKKWRGKGKPELDIGIGINTGDMVVGNMGSSSRMDYTLMGDNVNLGARLEGTNKVYKTNIIISEFTYEYVKDSVIVRELDVIRVKGKELPVKIYELIDIKE